MTTGGWRAPSRALLWLVGRTRHARSQLDRITVCLLVPAGLFALVFGVHDAAVADDLGIRTIGAGLAALGLVIGYAVVIRLERGVDAEGIEMLACLVVAAIACGLIATQLLGRYVGFVWPLIQLTLLVSFGIGSLASARVLWSGQKQRGRTFQFNEFKLLGSAVSLGAVIGILQFWYTNVYLPGSAEPSLSITPSIGTLSLRSTAAASRVLVTARIDLDNTSGARLEVVGAEYFFYGTCVYAPSKLSANQQVMKAMSGGAPATLQGEQYRELVGFGRLPLQAQIINAGETDHQFVTGILKPGYFDFASIVAYVVLARPTLHLDKATKFPGRAKRIAAAATPQGPPCTHLKPDAPTGSTNTAASVTYASEIDDNSWLHRIARGEQYLRIRYSTDPSLPVVIGVSPHRAQGASPDYNEAMSRLYGITYDVSRAGVILPATGAQRTLQTPRSPRARHRRP
jgi:hypothetical protein